MLMKDEIARRNKLIALHNKARAVRRAYEQIFARGKSKHRKQVNIRALTALVGIIADSRQPRGVHLDYRTATPINNRTGQPRMRGAIF